MTDELIKISETHLADNAVCRLLNVARWLGPVSLLVVGVVYLLLRLARDCLADSVLQSWLGALHLNLPRPGHGNGNGNGNGNGIGEWQQRVTELQIQLHVFSN